MLLIILGIVVMVLSIRWIFKQDFYSKTYVLDTLKASVCILIGIGIGIAGFGVPLHGYHEPIVVQEYELCEMVEASNVYVIENHNRVPFFKYVADSYKKGVYSPYNDLNIEIIVSDKYEYPKMVEYYIKPKIGILSFGLFGYSRDYKIFATEENIKRFEQ